MRGTLLLLGLLAAAGPLFPALDGEIKSKRRDLWEIEHELSLKKKEREETAQKAEDLAREAERVSREIEESRRALDTVQSRIADTEAKRRAAEERLWASRMGMGQWTEVLSREIERLYVRRMVEGSAAFVELAYREAAIRDKVSGLSFARHHHAQVEGLRDELVGLEVELQKLRLRREQEEARGKRLRERVQALRKTVEGRKAFLEKDIRELQASARKLEKFIQNLIREQAQAQAAAGQSAARAKPIAHHKQGRLPWPIEGKVIERYGRAKHPELDTYVFSNGIKLRPAPSDAVRAVDQGEVVYAGEFMSYGLMALVQHPDSLHSVYAHLGRLNVQRGQKVSVGEIIGSPGQDGGRQPVVYFELRVGGVAVDPLLWLQ